MTDLEQEIESLTASIRDFQEKLTSNAFASAAERHFLPLFRLKCAVDDMRLTIWCLLQKEQGSDSIDLLESLKMHRIVEMLRAVRQSGRAFDDSAYRELAAIDRISSSAVLQHAATDKRASQLFKTMSVFAGGTSSLRALLDEISSQPFL